RKANQERQQAREKAEQELQSNNPELWQDYNQLSEDKKTTRPQRNQQRLPHSRRTSPIMGYRWRQKPCPERRHQCRHRHPWRPDQPASGHQRPRTVCRRTNRQTIRSWRQPESGCPTGSPCPPRRQCSRTSGAIPD
uniref:hypothetical protein n=1 Tax=Snodgrassella communis TaxID=2946699 RepID=UPI001EF58F33